MINYAYELLEKQNRNRKCYIRNSLGGRHYGCNPGKKIWTYTGKSRWAEKDKTNGYYPGGGISNSFEMKTEDEEIIYIHPESWIEWIQND